MKDLRLLGVGAVAALVLFSPLVLREGEWHISIAEIISPPSKVLFVGDIMLDRSVARHARNVGGEKLFDDVKNIFAEHDVVVGNLEGTITDNLSVSEASSTILRFTFDPSLAGVLHDAGVTTVSLANNHALDFGEFGFDDTRHYLNEVGIAAFGSPYNEQLATAATVNDKELCFVGYHELYQRDPSTVVQKILEINSTCDQTVVFAHWGEEYVSEPSRSQQELARLFVDTGADLVVGAHPHVVQTLEVYNNVAIFYSLGNFIFDQGWRPEVRRGLMVSVEFGDKETTFNLLPVNSYLEATPADVEVSAAVLADLGVDASTFVLSR